MYLTKWTFTNNTAKQMKKNLNSKGHNWLIDTRWRPNLSFWSFLIPAPLHEWSKLADEPYSPLLSFQRIAFTIVIIVAIITEIFRSYPTNFFFTKKCFGEFHSKMWWKHFWSAELSAKTRENFSLKCFHQRDAPLSLSDVSSGAISGLKWHIHSPSFNDSFIAKSRGPPEKSFFSTRPENCR